MNIGSKAIGMKFGLLLVVAAVVVYMVKFRNGKKNGSN